MRPTRLVVTVILTAIALSTVSCAASRFIGYASKPDAPLPAGQVQHPALQAPVKVTFDAQHVPHIVAENEHDLWFALGYIQARDRLFQMDMLRRMAAGRT
ncbi:MAG TPA: penicillin acylase family protein, partial [Myxococcota bacterium]|nr:penicillin acylase family protein [Myxococcota bacterium]